MLLIIVVVFVNVDSLTDYSATEGIHLSYYEDETKNTTINDITSSEYKDLFVEKTNSIFLFGNSTSKYWIKIEADNIEELKEYIAVHSANVQFVTLYIGNEVLYSGWGNMLNNNSELLTYPVFDMSDFSEEELMDYPIYIEVESCYMYNFEIEFYSHIEYLLERNVETGFSLALIGALIAVFLMNIVIFIWLRKKEFFVFGWLIFFVGIQQADFVGIFNMYPSILTQLIMGFSIQAGYLFMCFIALLFILVSNVKDFSVVYFRIFISLVFSFIFGIVLTYFNINLANSLSFIFAAIMIFLGIIIGFKIHLYGHKNLRLFLFGWSFLIWVCFIGMMRSFHFSIKNSTVVYASFFCIVVTCFLFAFGVAAYVREDQILHKKTTEKVQKTEMALLQTQIKPHFLYNTLATIESLCTINPQKAKNMLIDFSDYLRANIDFSAESRLITLEQEINTVKHYISLEQTRFGERIRIEYNIENEYFMLPPFSIQAIVENSVRYGITKKIDGGTVFINVKQDENNNIIIIQDDGVGFDVNLVLNDGKTHIGIENTKKRIEKLVNGVFEISSQKGEGTTVKIIIPKE